MRTYDVQLSFMNTRASYTWPSVREPI